MAPWTWNFEDWNEVDETPASQIVFKALLDARRYGAEQIHFEKFSQPEVELVICSVSFEKVGSCEEIAFLPRELWPELVNRLKVLVHIKKRTFRFATQQQ